jgi:hypothetical protein
MHSNCQFAALMQRLMHDLAGQSSYQAPLSWRRRVVAPGSSALTTAPQFWPVQFGGAYLVLSLSRMLCISVGQLKYNVYFFQIRLLVAAVIGDLGSIHVYSFDITFICRLTSRPVLSRDLTACIRPSYVYTTDQSGCP